MTATFNAAEVERLVAEARADDETLRVVVSLCRCSTADLIVEGHADECLAASVDAARGKAQRRALANLATYDQLRQQVTCLRSDTIDARRTFNTESRG